MSRIHSLASWRKKLPAKALQLSSNFNTNLGRFNNYLFLDFESTCDNHLKIEKQEIIEFPCIWVDSNLNVISKFHRYIKPIHNPILTQFCMQLTGISQTMIEHEETFHQVLNSFLSWQNEISKTVGENNNYTFVTCGDWDLKTMLPDQCQLSQVSVPPTMKQWINVKKVFLEVTSQYPKSLKEMCRFLEISFTGREHRGIDDCWNMLEVMRVLKTKYHL